jgi:hypothetical protein
VVSFIRQDQGPVKRDGTYDVASGDVPDIAAVAGFMHHFGNQVLAAKYVAAVVRAPARPYLA